MRQKIFVGSSREAIDVCRAVQAELSDDFDVTVWNQGVFRLSQGGLDSLLESLDSSDSGIFILRGDDVTSRRGESEPTVRDNVVLELGMFIGRLGRDRAFMLTPSMSPLRLPSDLHGVTTAEYDSARVERGDGRAAVGPACTTIRGELRSRQRRMPEKPRSQVRLDDAMARLGLDLESLLGAPHGNSRSGDQAEPAHATTRIGRAAVHLEVGRIEDSNLADSETVIALPANEYFDDTCITDRNSSLGAFVYHLFVDDTAGFVNHVKAELEGLPSERVPRTESRIDESYGIGQAIFLSRLSPEHRIILVSATTERTGVGLRAEPHFLYAALRGVFETMNSVRLKVLVMPVFGSGHGGIPLVAALLFNLLALRWCLADDVGRNIREVRIRIFSRAVQLTDDALQEVITRAAATA